jgi:SAM-dependent methyltransferase
MSTAFRAFVTSWSYVHRYFRVRLIDVTDHDGGQAGDSGSTDSRCAALRGRQQLLRRCRRGLDCPMPEVMDWDAAYRDEVFAGPPPWNIGEPQPEFSGLIRDGKVVGDVLDVGCGVGDIALDLAARGYRVVGIDVAKPAIAAATKAAEERGLGTATFVQGDLASLDYHDCFDTVLDCLLLHSLPVEARDDYLRWAHRAAKPGAAMYVLALITDALPADSPFPVPNLFSQEELLEIVAKYWRVEEIRPAFVSVKLPPLPDDLPPPSFSFDDKGRAKLPAALVVLRR